MTTAETPVMAANPNRCRRTFKERGYRLAGPWLWHGPSGFKFLLSRGTPTNGVIGSVIVSQAEHDGDEWLHASIAWDNATPDYDDLATLKLGVFGPTRFAYQVFASEQRHVNIHEHALHLWGRADGQRVLPDFGAWGTI